MTGSNAQQPGVGRPARPRRRNVLAAVVILASLSVAASWRLYHHRAHLNVVRSRTAFPADGRPHTIAEISVDRGERIQPDEFRTSSGSSPEVTVLAGPDASKLSLIRRAPVLPGAQTVRVSWRSHTLTVPVTYTADLAPSAAAPGLPDWMPLHTAADRAAFRRWFTTLADRAAAAAPADLPAEISDCSALLRYCFRASLRGHDDRWYATAPALERLNLPSVTQWTYLDTLLGAALFRTLPGTFAATDASSGAFAQFADAKTLAGLNTFRVGRDLRSARPGDLLFYRLLQLDSHHNQQYHSMIVTGERAEWAVYHTGPINTPNGSAQANAGKGEVRRVLLRDLLRHPDPRWRPEPANANFLGVYRWDILAEEP